VQALPPPLWSPATPVPRCEFCMAPRHKPYPHPWSPAPTWTRAEGHGSRGGRGPWPHPRGHDCPEVSEGKQAPLVGSRAQGWPVRGGNRSTLPSGGRKQAGEENTQGRPRSWGDRAEDLPLACPHPGAGPEPRTEKSSHAMAMPHPVSSTGWGVSKIVRARVQIQDTGPEGDRRSHRTEQPSQGPSPKDASTRPDSSARLTP